jgi:hypothetical protein
MVYMSMKGGGAELKMPEGNEAHEGIQVEQVENLNEYSSQIRTQCRYNALNTGENRAAVSVRRGELSAVKHTMHKPLPDAVFVAKSGDKVVGFLAVKRSVENGKKAQIRQLWTARPDYEQRRVMAHLIQAAKHELTGDGYTRLKAERISASSGFNIVHNSPNGGRYLQVVDQKDPEGTESIEISPEEENELPLEIRAANDDVTDTPDRAKDNDSFENAT